MLFRLHCDNFLSALLVLPDCPDSDLKAAIWPHSVSCLMKFTILFPLLWFFSYIYIMGTIHLDSIRSALSWQLFNSFFLLKPEVKLTTTDSLSTEPWYLQYELLKVFYLAPQATQIYPWLPLSRPKKLKGSSQMSSHQNLQHMHDTSAIGSLHFTDFKWQASDNISSL